MDMADALKGALNPQHVHWMLMVDTSTVTLDLLDDMVLNMGQHVDQVLSSERSSFSSAFSSVHAKKDLDQKMEVMSRQLDNLLAALSSSHLSHERHESGGRGRGGGRNATGGRGKKKVLLELWW